MKRFIGKALLLSCAAISFGVLAQPTQNGAETPITDDQGRVRYIIDFAKDATQGQPTQINTGESLNDGLPEWQKPEMRHFAKGIAKQYALTPVSTTSWVGNSITAYLTPGQVNALQHDKRVTLITQDGYLTFSGWIDGASGGEKISWGTDAVHGGNTINHTGKGINVYVLDGGVGYHTDLGGYSNSQVQRYNPAGYNTVGCYAHATHVAGIIGAQVNNAGTRGVNPGVPIVSVSIGDNNAGACSTSSLSISSINLGMDMIVNLVIQSGSGKPGIVNISINSTSASANIFSFGTTLGNKLHSLITIKVRS